jgi:hypothetical protein
MTMINMHALPYTHRHLYYRLPYLFSRSYVCARVCDARQLLRAIAFTLFSSFFGCANAAVHAVHDACLACHATPHGQVLVRPEPEAGPPSCTAAVLGVFINKIRNHVPELVDLIRGLIPDGLEEMHRLGRDAFRGCVAVVLLWNLCYDVCAVRCCGAALL